MLKEKKQKLSNESVQKKPVRLWPGIVIVILQLLGRFSVPALFPEALEYGVMTGILGGFVLVVWWAFFSRAPIMERWGAIIFVVIVMFAIPPFLHKSVAMGGNGMLFPVLSIPVLSLAFVIWVVVSRKYSKITRRITMLGTILFSCGVWTLIRTGGTTANFENDLNWRWTDTPEEQLLAETIAETMTLPALRDTIAKWPGFRGSNRNSIITDLKITTNWTESPPIEMWRQPIGPGWSSFAVSGNLFYTQEQRGDDEVVACYNLLNGKPVWKHIDSARFWESNGGAGPRGTPTIYKDRVYTLGGTGILNALDADNGSAIWSRNTELDTDTKVPMWGYSSSPLVVDDLVIVAASSALVAYDIATGKPRWFHPAEGDGYSSPHLLTIDGITQVLQLSRDGLKGVSTADGALLWEHLWKGYPIVQPAQTNDGDILISVSNASGIRRLTVTQTTENWTVEEHWTSLQLKPYFNDFVIHKGHAFGIDGRKLSCIDIKDGNQKWNGGRYGSSQILLLADQDLLLVLTEKGKLVLVEITPDRFTELARISALEGKTWNHPVLVDDILLVRNSQEMAAFRLQLANDSKELSTQ